ncbi:MAG: hypothetical protein II453_15550 [Alphaproteobacteria bacterium]|nr:hypothetical protein [Alphaproteobacteria bacterium]
MITPINQNKTPFVTPDAEKPDLANGPFLSFTGDNGSVTYIQMTNDRFIWFKQVSAEGMLLNVTAFDIGCSKYVTDYFAQRLKETKL